MLNSHLTYGIGKRALGSGSMVAGSRIQPHGLFGSDRKGAGHGMTVLGGTSEQERERTGSPCIRWHGFMITSGTHPKNIVSGSALPTRKILDEVIMRLPIAGIL